MTDGLWIERARRYSRFGVGLAGLGTAILVLNINKGNWFFAAIDVVQVGVCIWIVYRNEKMIRRKIQSYEDLKRLEGPLPLSDHQREEWKE